MDAVPAPAPGSRRVALATGTGVAAVLLLPGATRWIPGSLSDEEHLRTTLAFGALATALLWPRARSGPERNPFAGFHALALAPVAAFSIRAMLAASRSRVLHATVDLFSSPALWLPSLLFGCLLLWGAATAARRRSDDAGFVRGLAAGLAATGVVAALWVLVDRSAGRPGVGPFGRAGVAGPALAAFLPFVATARFVPRWAALGPTLVVAAALVATGSRTAFGALAAGAFVAAWRLRRDPRARVALVALGLVLAGGFAWAVLSLSGGSAAADTVRVRAGLARASARLVAEEPVLGQGPGGFRAGALRVRDPEEARLSHGGRPLAAHDDVLHAAVETGVPAALLLATFVVLAVARAARATGTAPSAERAFPFARTWSLATVAFASLGEDPLLAAPTALAFGLLAGTLPAAAPRRGPLVGSRWAAATLLAVACAAAALGTLADHRVASLRHDLARAPRSTAGDAAAAERLSLAAVRMGIHPEEGYLRASLLARGDLPIDARVAYERVLDHDPGSTEARLDLAEVERTLAGPAAAREVLEEARRADPTRFDVPLRLGHLLLGEEPAPSEAKPPENVVEILRLYDEAHALDPSRFEFRVALARLDRRRGDRIAAGNALRAAAAGGKDLPAELLLESFRLAEAEKAPAFETVKILVLALAANPGLAPVLRAEAVRFLTVAEREERAALDAAVKTLAPPAFSKANLDFDAAALRLAGLSTSGAVPAATIRDEARKAASEGRHRRALAGFRALLADPWAALDADLALEAAKSAARVDGALATQLSARGRTLLGYEALARGKVEEALRDLGAAVEKDPSSVAARYGLARALARAGKADDALVRLREAVAMDASALERARGEPDLRDAVAHGWPPLPK
jgi:tetratricopeptide (TPR) repeat protein